MNSRHDIPRLIEYYQNGIVDLDAMGTSEYSLDDINQGYHDLKSAKNVRGVLRMS